MIKFIIDYISDLIIGSNKLSKEDIRIAEHINNNYMHFEIRSNYARNISYENKDNAKIIKEWIAIANADRQSSKGEKNENVYK